MTRIDRFDDSNADDRAVTRSIEENAGASQWAFGRKTVCLLVLGISCVAGLFFFICLWNYPPERA